MPERRVVFVIYPDFLSIDLVGPHEVFTQAGYDCRIAATTAGPVAARGGLAVQAECGLADVDPDGIDTLIVVGGRGVDAACADPALVDWLRAAAPLARRYGSVCSGVLLLAATGLLAGRRVTTHWARTDQLRRDHPDLRVDTDPIFVNDGPLWTSAGATAGMDLALALVEEDLGRAVAHGVAQQLVLFLRRPGSQSQFSVPLWSQQPSTDPIRAVVTAIQADPGARHTINDLAGHAGLSARQLQRRFAAELGVSPAEYVEGVRIEAARRTLTEGDESLVAVARKTGFGAAETLRRAFHRRLGVSPSSYRDRFRTTRPTQEQT